MDGKGYITLTLTLKVTTKVTPTQIPIFHLEQGHHSSPNPKSHSKCLSDKKSHFDFFGVGEGGGTSPKVTLTL